MAKLEPGVRPEVMSIGCWIVMAMVLADMFAGRGTDSPGLQGVVFAYVVCLAVFLFNVRARRQRPDA